MSKWIAEAPEHYTQGGVETIDFIGYVLDLLGVEASEVWCVGNAIKYARRAGLKDDWKEDARKCADYLYRFKYGEWCPRVQGGDE